VCEGELRKLKMRRKWFLEECRRSNGGDGERERKKAEDEKMVLLAKSLTSSMGNNKLGHHSTLA
jgi:hypothetical protein